MPDHAHAVPPPVRVGFLSWPPICMALGVAIIAMAAFIEERWLASEPYSGAVVLANHVPPKTPGAPAYVRRVAKENYPPSEIDAVLKQVPDPDLAAAVKKMKLDEGEAVVAIALPAEYFQAVLVSGRLPVAGAPEVLAGDLAQLASFKLDGVTFQVVGRLRDSYPVGFQAYVLPYDKRLESHFGAAAGATLGSYHEDGHDKLPDLLPDEGNATEAKADEAKKEADPYKVIGLHARTLPILSWLVLTGLMMVALGACTFTARWCAAAAGQSGSTFSFLRREVRLRPRLFAGTHVLLYGVFFSALVQSILNPGLQYRLFLLVQAAFSEGELSYIGNAYASGDILDAAAATFTNNYLLHTVGLTFFAPAGLWWKGLLTTPALIPLLMPWPIGVFINAFSFGLVGLVMAPTWTHVASGYWYHSLTMAMELEAYVLASFVVLAWPLRLINGIRNGFPITGIRGCILLIGDGILLTGLLLAAAAAYEAATLILLMH